VDAGAILNGDSYKGYEYSLSSASARRKESDSDKDRFGNYST